jgi:hypothetical protein
MPQRVRMIANRFILSHIRLATFKSTESVFGARNKTVLNPTTLNNSGIQIHGGPISQFFIIVIDGVHIVHVITAHPTRSHYKKM